MERINLIKPTMEYENQVMSFKDEMLKNGDSLDGCAGLEQVESYEQWLELDNWLFHLYGEGYSPSEIYLAVRESDNAVVGIVDYRRPLTDFLLQYGGHVGYSVRPCERRKGYAKEILSLIVERGKELGEEKILLTCDKENLGSSRTIIANGGVLENEVEDVVGLGKSGTIQRYWITL